MVEELVVVHRYISALIINFLYQGKLSCLCHNSQYGLFRWALKNALASRVKCKNSQSYCILLSELRKPERAYSVNRP